MRPVYLAGRPDRQPGLGRPGCGLRHLDVFDGRRLPSPRRDRFSSPCLLLLPDPSSKAVEPTGFDESPSGNLPAYLTEPAPARRSLRQWRDDRSRPVRRDAVAPRASSASAVPFSKQIPRLSTSFSRMVELHRDLLPAAVAAWWAAGQKAGSVRVYRRLELRPPEGDAGAGWRMQGRVRRLTTLHWTPVVVELWPKYDDFAVITMTPQRPVLATRRYFRLGHAVLDRLWAELAAREDSYSARPVASAAPIATCSCSRSARAEARSSSTPTRASGPML